jgi:hypothetical protein
VDGTPDLLGGLARFRCADGTRGRGELDLPDQFAKRRNRMFRDLRRVKVVRQGSLEHDRVVVPVG